ncbi:RNA-directed DNA polymerase, eukaryota [Tanacetum coccineum]
MWTVPLGGCEFTWCHQSGSKMSKLDRFLISEGLMGFCPNISAITLDRYLSDHKLSTLEGCHDYVPFHCDSIYEEAKISKGADKTLIDEKKADKEIINKRIHVMNSLQDLEKLEMSEIAQKVKINWSIEGDENSRFFHGMLNKKRNQQAIRGILKEGTWVDDPKAVKNEFLSHFKERNVSKEEIKRAVWDCGSDKSPGPDGFTFGFYRRYWDTIKNDMVDAISYFCNVGMFPKSGNASFIALIPKMQDARVVKDFRPISLIGSVYELLERSEGDMNFKTKFPRVYALESDKKITVASKMNHNDFGLSLRRAPRDGVELEQFNNLNVFLAGTMLSDSNDRWSWSLVGSGKFLVASVRNLIDEHRLGGSSYKTRWIHTVPIKINILPWKVRYDFLPTHLNLSRRGIEIQSIICPSCNKEVESTNHIFFACSLMRNIYRKIASWWEFLYVEFDSYKLVGVVLSLKNDLRHKNIMERDFQCYCGG